MKVLLVIALVAVAAQAQTAAAGYETVVHAESPLPDNPVDVNEFPASVQVFTRQQLLATGATTIEGALEQLAGATLTDEQGVPAQNDITLRGLKASPVTGLSQGVGVYVDGVRVNEPDVEEVNFDLVPLDDVERIEIIRGPNTLFGRNNLAGAIQIITQRGQGAPNVHGEASYGSFQYERYHLSGGASAGHFDVYGSALYSTELGFRAAGSTQQGRLFVKGGYQDERNNLTLSYQFQRDAIQQPGSLPLSLERVDPSANFTAGDIFSPTLHAVTFNLAHQLDQGFALNANAFGRFLTSTELNSNFDGPDTLWGTRTAQLGATFQLQHAVHAGAWENHALVGLEYTHNLVDARLTAVQNAGSLADCLADGSLDDCPLRQVTTILSDVQNAPSAYLLERVRFIPNPRRPQQAISLTVGVRADGLTHVIGDVSPINPGQAAGDATFFKVLPTAGLTYSLSEKLGAYAAFKEGFRAPSFLELTCANPAAPCVGLEAGVAADPTLTALQPVVAEDFELGVRLHPWKQARLNVDVYRTDLFHDIYSVSPTPTQIYFQNVGNTRRQGVEADLYLTFGTRVDAQVDYTYTRATFQSPVNLETTRTGEGTEHVSPGNVIPTVPAHHLSGRVRVAILPWLGLSANAVFVGSQFAQGDEANQTTPLPAYALVGLGADARWRHFWARAQVSNLLASRYLTYGTWAENGAGVTEPFVSPGEPIRVTGTVGFDY